MPSQAYTHATSGLPTSKRKLHICPSLLLKISNTAHTLAKTVFIAFTNLSSRQATATETNDKSFLLQMVLSWQTQTDFKQFLIIG